MKLSKTQVELLDAMRAGVKVSYMPYSGRLNPQAYWYRFDTFKKCTKAAERLIELGIAEEYNVTWRSSYLREKVPT